MIQQNLGATLSLRAKHAAHHAEARDYLGQAIDAFSTALKLRSETEMPVEWAMTTQNLAVALLEKAKLTDGTKGTALLEKAKDLLENTLDVRTQSDTPFDWALTQENLAIVTKALGERTQAEVSAKYLERAQTHILAALRIYEGEAGSFYRAKARTLKNEIQQTSLERHLQ
jgi:tetratricopeptide (TPR) repeat protein